MTRYDTIRYGIRYDANFLQRPKRYHTNSKQQFVRAVQNVFIEREGDWESVPVFRVFAAYVCWKKTLALSLAREQAEGYTSERRIANIIGLYYLTAEATRRGGSLLVTVFPVARESLARVTERFLHGPKLSGCFIIIV